MKMNNPSRISLPPAAALKNLATNQYHYLRQDRVSIFFYRVTFYDPHGSTSFRACNLNQLVAALVLGSQPHILTDSLQLR